MFTAKERQGILNFALHNSETDEHPRPCSGTLLR